MKYADVASIVSVRGVRTLRTDTSYSYPSNITVSLTRVTIIIECYARTQVLSETKKRDDKEINMSLSILKDHLRRIDELIDKSFEERARDAKLIYEGKDKILEHIRRALRDNARLEKRLKELEDSFMKEARVKRRNELARLESSSSSSSSSYGAEEKSSLVRDMRIKARRSRERLESTEYKLSTRCSNLKSLSSKMRQLKENVKQEKRSTSEELSTLRSKVLKQSVYLHRDVQRAITSGQNVRLRIRAQILKEIAEIRSNFRTRRARVLRNLERERMRLMSGLSSSLKIKNSNRKGDLKLALDARRRSYAKTQKESEDLKNALQEELKKLDRSLLDDGE